MHCHVALTTEEDVQALVKLAGRHFLEGAEAGLAVCGEDGLQIGRSLHVELIYIIEREIMPLFRIIL